MSLTKRLCSFLAGLALCGTCLFTGACAEAAAPDRWQGEYQAYGRTIKVDTEITGRGNNERAVPGRCEKVRRVLLWSG